MFIPLNTMTFVLKEGNLDVFYSSNETYVFFNDSHNFPFFVALSVAAYTNLGHACSVIDCNTVGISSLYIVPLLLEDVSLFHASRLLCFYPSLQTC